MREVVPHLQSNKAKAGQAGDMLGSRAMLNSGGALENSAASLKSDAPHSAHILTYGKPGKVAVSNFGKRKRGLSALLNARTVPVLALCVEFMLVAGASFGAGDIYHRYTIGQLPYWDFYLAATMLLAAIFTVPCGLNRDYSLTRLALTREQLRSVFLHWNTAYLLLAFALFISHATEFYSRGSMIAQYFAGVLAALGFRLLLARLVTYSLDKGALGGKRIVIAGDAASVAYVARRLRTDGRGIDIVGTVRFPAAERVPGDPADRLRDVREAIAAVEEIARGTDLDEIVISMPWSESGSVKAFVEGLAVVPATIHLAPDASGAWAHHLSPARVGSLPTIKLCRAPLTLKDRILKRGFDLIAGSMLLLVALPLFAVVGVLIKCDSSGPVFFRQRRHGFNQGEFRIFKFRTMTTLDDGQVIRQATRNDTRITRIGGFLRRTNLDELPQLINVLAGHMSLVGPRPHALAHNSEFEQKIRLYAKRHNVKPGITGWSQVNGHRGETETLEKMEKRVEFDVFYIDNWSMLLDVSILYLTIFSLKSFRNAY
jgi:Undecaprenyl-phosphate glucose phosphotransferase